MFAGRLVRSVKNSFVVNTRFLHFRFSLILVIAAWLVMAEAEGFFEEVEDATYEAVEKGIVASGKSKAFASCFVLMLRLQGTSKEVTKISNIINSAQMVEKLLENSEFANKICSNGPIVALVLVILFIIVVLCTCRLCWCCLSWMCCPTKKYSSEHLRNNRKLRWDDRVEMDTKSQSLYYGA